MSRSRRHLGTWLAAGWLVLIVSVTLIPQPQAAGRAAATPIYCILCGDLGSVDFLLNTILFLPLGLTLVVAGFSWRRAVVVGWLVTVVIELLQVNLVAGRDASLGDVLANTLGTAIGATLALHAAGLLTPAPAAARRLALLYALALLWIWAGTAWALGPSFPQGARWFGAWAPELGNYEQFLGKPLMVTAGREPLLPGAAMDQDRLEDAITAHPDISFRAVLAEPTADLAPIGLVVDEWHGNVILIGQDHDDLQFSLAMRAAIVRLRSPAASLPHGLAGSPGDTVEAEGALRDGALEVSARNGNRILSRRLPLSASWGWSLVTPWDSVLGASAGLLTALWIIGLVAVLAYWCVLAGGASIAIVPATVALLLGAVPYAAGFSAVDWSEWTAALVGVAAGALAAQPALRARPAAAQAGTGEAALREQEA